MEKDLWLTDEDIHGIEEDEEVIKLRRKIDKLEEKIELYQDTIKSQKEVIDKANKYINDNLIISSILDGKKYYTLNNYSFDYRELLEILDDKEVE